MRDVLLGMDLNPHWSGVGPDGGRDLTFNEPGLIALGRKDRTWVVSCKDNSISGDAVGVDDLGAVVETVRQHDGQGFLLVCTTHPSAAAVERLRALEANSGSSLKTHYWDGSTLERILSSPSMWAIAQQFMPVSAQAAGWRIFGTTSPNQWVAVHRGQHFHLSNRIGGNDAFDLAALDRRLDELEALENEDRLLRVRGVWLDDAKGGGYVWYVDCMVPEQAEAPLASQIERALDTGRAREDGQFHTFEVEVRPITWHRDHFDMDHYRFYDRLPRFV